MASSSSFSSVVSGLVRAQMGSSIPQNTVDEELDRRVAELILKEARQKEAKYGKTGSYSPQTTGNAAKTNKRFLTSIIKSTDEHNKTILRAQAESALEIKQQREREEREERMRRAQEAVAARTGTSSSSWRSNDEGGHRRRSRSGERHERHHRSSRHDQKRERSPYSDADHNHRVSRHKRRKYDEHSGRRSASPLRRRDRSKEGTSKLEDDYVSSRKSSKRERDEDGKQRDSRRSRSRSPRRGEHQSGKRKSRRDESTQAERKGHSHRHKDSKRRRSSLPRMSPEGSNRPDVEEIMNVDGEAPTGDDLAEAVGPLPPLPGAAPKDIPSKMDKYFEKSYDPRLDVAPALASKDGLIPPEAFDNWDMMLEIVRVRREEKEERKRLEKLHRSGSSSRSKEVAAAALPPKGETEDLLSIQYTKRGGVREWDEGKKLT